MTHFMFSVTHFSCKHDAWRAIAGVARVVRRVTAGSAPAAGGAAGGWFGAAADRRHQHLRATLTMELVETFNDIQ